MVQHSHEKHVDGCFRCELSADEVAQDVRFRCSSCGASEMTSKHTSALRCQACNVWMDEVEDVLQHDDECADELTYSGACKHYTPGRRA